MPRRTRQLKLTPRPMYGEMWRAAGGHLAAVAGEVADSDDSFAREAQCASSLAQRVVAEPDWTLHDDGCDHALSQSA